MEPLSISDFEALHRDDCVTKVMMLFSNEATEGNTIVIVEGADDNDVYDAFFDKGKTFIHPDGNCDNHIRILNELNGAYENRLIAIKDADFDRLNKKVYEYGNLFLTDGYDLEGMVLKNGMPDNLNVDDRERCMGIDVEVLKRELMDISYMKWNNNVNGLHLTFDKSSVLLSIEDYIKDVLENTSNGNIGYDKSVLDAFKSKHPTDDLDNLTNGHDLFEKVYKCAHDAQKENFPKRDFFRRLRSSYSLESFSTTILYNNLNSWESMHQTRVLEV